jgi:cation transporter-like permease
MKEHMKIIHTKKLHGYFHKIAALKRRKHHPLLHHVHKKHRLSKKTLFYMKEYGPHSHVAKTIIRESAKILIFTSIISSFGGLLLEEIKTLFISLVPLIILMPSLNDMIGDYATIISSRFSTMLYEGKIDHNWRTNRELRKLFLQIFIIAIIMAAASGAISLFISQFSGYQLTTATVIKIMSIAIIDVMILVSILFLVAIVAGLYFYNKQEDPNNFLIPLTTALADFGNMVLLAVLVLLLF